MSESEIFLDALEVEGVARTAFLDEACAGEPVLRRRVETLLRRHYEDPDYLNVPAMEQLATAEESLAFLQKSTTSGALGRIDHYEALEVIGRGSTGVVLKARDTKLQRVVAVKALLPRLATSAAARQRFVREAQAAAAVRDDHVVAIHAVSDDGPVPYLVMEYVHGQTLAERVRRNQPLELKETLRIGMQLAAGLAAAHAQGLVHRDVKPANVLLENSVQRVKVTDFGLAQAAQVAQVAQVDAPEREVLGVLAGTPSYMSPEQARGEPTDHRTDLFSMGSILYLLCTGKPAFTGHGMAEVLERVRCGQPRPIREMNPRVPEWLSGLIAKLHAPLPSERPASARVVADLLAEQLALLQQPPLPRTRPFTSSKWRPRWRVDAKFAGLMVLLGGAVALLLFWRNNGPQPEAKGTRSSAVPRLVSLDLQRSDIAPALLTLAGGGDATQAPQELAAVLGDGGFLFPRVGRTAWMEQSPDGSVLAVPLDGDVVLFDGRTGAYRGALQGPGGRVFLATFSRDGNLLAATTRFEEGGGFVRTWDLTTQAVLFTHAQQGPLISNAAVFSADGSHLFTESNGGLCIWDARSGTQRQALPLDGQGIGALGLNANGRRLALAKWPGKNVQVFDWSDGKLTEVVKLKDHLGAVTAAVFSPDGRFLATGDGKELKLWNGDDLQEVQTVPLPADQLAFSPDGRVLYVASTLNTEESPHVFRRWDLSARRELPALAVHVAVENNKAFHCLSRDGAVLFVTKHLDATFVQAIDTTTGKELFPRQGHVAPLSVIAISPDGALLASAGADRVVKVWDLATRQVLHALAAHTDAVAGLAFSPDGSVLASGSRDGTIALWDPRTGIEMRALHGHARQSSHIQFSADGRVLAAGNERGEVKRWDVASGNYVGSLPGHQGTVPAIDFSRDGRWLASGGRDGSIRVLDLGTSVTRTFSMPSGVNHLQFSPANRLLAAVGDAPESMVRLWNLETGQETTWQHGTGNVLGLAFSPVGSLLATCSADGTVRLWDYQTPASAVRTLGPGPFGGAVRAVAFTPDGRYLATANANGTVYLLHVAVKPIAP